MDLICNSVDLVDLWHRDGKSGGTPVECTRPAIIEDRKMRHCFEHAWPRAVRGWMSDHEMAQLLRAVMRWPPYTAPGPGPGTSRDTTASCGSDPAPPT